MKNVMMNVKTTFKKVMAKTNERPILKLVRNITVAGIILLPHLAFAADPTGVLNSGMQTVTNTILGISAVAGGLALSFQGVQYHFAGDAQEKAHIVRNMKGTAIIAAIIGLAPTIINWISVLFHG